MLATVDARGVFTYIHAGSPGSVGDAGVYSRTMLKGYIEAGQWLPLAAGKPVSGFLYDLSLLLMLHSLFPAR